MGIHHFMNKWPRITEYTSWSTEMCGHHFDEDTHYDISIMPVEEEDLYIFFFSKVVCCIWVEVLRWQLILNNVSPLPTWRNPLHNAHIVQYFFLANEQLAIFFWISFKGIFQKTNGKTWSFVPTRGGRLTKPQPFFNFFKTKFALEQSINVMKHTHYTNGEAIYHKFILLLCKITQCM